MGVYVTSILMYGIYSEDGELDIDENKEEELWDSKDKLDFWKEMYTNDPWQALGICLHDTNEYNDNKPFRLDNTLPYYQEFKELCFKHNIEIPEHLKPNIGIYHFIYYY